MSEEEKKAVEYTEQLIGIKKDYVFVVQAKTIDNNEKNFKVLLNLIEKSQKENKELKEKLENKSKVNFKNITNI